MRSTPAARKRPPPRDYASPAVRRLRLWLCDLDRNLSDWELRRQECLARGDGRLAAECLAQVDRFLEQQHNVRCMLRARLAEEAGR
jgi:hypothetical protein